MSLGFGWDGQGGVSRRMIPLFSGDVSLSWDSAGHTRMLCSSGKTPHSYHSPFDRTRQGEASTAGNKQTIWVPGSLTFGVKWRSPTSSCEKLHSFSLVKELADPINSLTGLIQREF